MKRPIYLYLELVVVKLEALTNFVSKGDTNHEFSSRGFWNLDDVCAASDNRVA